ncbi:MAG: hypothetical protein GMKNLPBB_02789 [Myxococcota bacterium]|nr:hypothetical protein [Myxococcota bacterium]
MGKTFNWKTSILALAIVSWGMAGCGGEDAPGSAAQVVCKADGDCLASQRCASGKCVRRQQSGETCNRDSECSGGFFCSEGVCKPISRDATGAADGASGDAPAFADGSEDGANPLRDASPFDAGQDDAPIIPANDSGLTDTPAADADAGPVEPPRDSGPTDRTATDLAADAGSADTGPADAGAADAVADAGPGDTSPQDSGPADTGADTGPSDASPADGSDGGDAGAGDTGGSGTAVIVINEVMADPSSTPGREGQYVELANAGTVSASLEGWTLQINGRKLTLSAANGKVEIGPRQFLVIGATTDSAKNGYRRVTHAWPEDFSLPKQDIEIELLNPLGKRADRASIALARKGVSTERGAPITSGELASSWHSAATLITFLQETGYFSVDWGSPGRVNSRLKEGTSASPAASGTGKIEAPEDVADHKVTLAAGDYVVLQADVDRVNGDMDSLAVLLDSSGRIVASEWVDDTRTLDFFHYLKVPAAGVYTVRVYADPIALFKPASYAVRAGGLRSLSSTPQSLVLEVGKSQGLSIKAAYALADARVLELPAGAIGFNSADPAIATVNGDGLVTGVAAGTTNITAAISQSGGTLQTTIKTDVFSTQANDTCANAIDVTSGGDFTGGVLNLKDDYSQSISGCVSLSVSGPDAVFKVSPSAARTYKVTVTPTTAKYDPAILIYSDCAAQACVTGTVLNGPDDPESVQFNVAAGQTRFIIVDTEIPAGADPKGGKFTLKVEILP